jgi:hypothetical protein
MTQQKQEYKFTDYKQWDKLQGDAYKIFKKWYENNNTNNRYKHIKHAFNSLCKHYKLITITKYTEDNIIIKWKVTSFYKNKNKISWTFNI